MAENSREKLCLEYYEKIHIFRPFYERIMNTSFEVTFISTVAGYTTMNRSKTTLKIV